MTTKLLLALPAALLLTGAGAPNGEIRVRRTDLDEWLQTREDTP